MRITTWACRPFYQEKRDQFCALLAGLAPALHARRPAPISSWSITVRSATKPDVDYARRLTREAGVACIPVSVFCAAPGDARLLRFCFAKDSSTLERAAEILCRL